MTWSKEVLLFTQQWKQHFARWDHMGTTWAFLHSLLSSRSDCGVGHGLRLVAALEAPASGGVGSKHPTAARIEWRGGRGDASPPGPWEKSCATRPPMDRKSTADLPFAQLVPGLSALKVCGLLGLALAIAAAVVLREPLGKEFHVLHAKMVDLGNLRRFAPGPCFTDQIRKIMEWAILTCGEHRTQAVALWNAAVGSVSVEKVQRKCCRVCCPKTCRWGTCWKILCKSWSGSNGFTVAGRHAVGHVRDLQILQAEECTSLLFWWSWFGLVADA